MHVMLWYDNTIWEQNVWKAMEQIRNFPNHENNEDENEKMCDKFTNNTYTKNTIHSPVEYILLYLPVSIPLSVYLSKFAAIIYNPTTIELTVAVVAHNLHTMALNIFHNFHICVYRSATFITSEFFFVPTLSKGPNILLPNPRKKLLSIFFRFTSVMHTARGLIKSFI